MHGNKVVNPYNSRVSFDQLLLVYLMLLNSSIYLTNTCTCTMYTHTYSIYICVMWPFVYMYIYVYCIHVYNIPFLSTASEVKDGQIAFCDKGLCTAYYTCNCAPHMLRVVAVSGTALERWRDIPSDIPPTLHPHI